MEETLREFKSRLGYTFKSPQLLTRALTHASAGAQGAPSNERLEFLGDAVVGLVISAYLFQEMPDSSEGDMTVIKSGVVSRKSLGVAGRELGIQDVLIVDEGLRSRERYPNSMVAGAYESVVGAIYIDGGLEPAREFVLRTLADRMDEVQDQRHLLSCKSLLQQHTQAENKGVPHYEIVKTEGPDHQRRFLAAVWVQGEQCGSGWGVTKKDAERAAAHEALDACYAGWQHGQAALSDAEE